MGLRLFFLLCLQPRQRPQTTFLFFVFVFVCFCFCFCHNKRLRLNANDKKHRQTKQIIIRMHMNSSEGCQAITAVQSLQHRLEVSDPLGTLERARLQANQITQVERISVDVSVVHDIPTLRFA